MNVSLGCASSSTYAFYFYFSLSFSLPSFYESSSTTFSTFLFLFCRAWVNCWFYVFSFGFAFTLYGATCANLFTKKIPEPWHRPVGFNIQSPPLFLKSSKNIMYSLGKKYVDGKKSQSDSFINFCFINSLLCLLTFFMSISFLHNFIIVEVPEYTDGNDWLVVFEWFLLQRHRLFFISHTIVDSRIQIHAPSISSSIAPCERSCRKKF